jgi:PRTRC genetic system protein B
MIYAHIDTGAELDIRLREALFIYASPNGYGSERLVLESRPILNGPEGLEYGAGIPVDRDYVARMLWEDTPPSLHLLDTRLLAVGSNEAAWWSPASRRTLFFSPESGMVKHSGEEVAMPALLFHVRKGQLRIRAIACRGRPRPGTPLYVAPFWNIYPGGALCAGTMPIPTGEPAQCIDAWETAFWDSAFTDPHVASLCAHPKGYGRMLHQLRHRPRFPNEWLVPANERTHEWLNRQ